MKVLVKNRFRFYTAPQLFAQVTLEHPRAIAEDTLSEVLARARYLAEHCDPKDHSENLVLANEVVHICRKALDERGVA